MDASRLLKNKNQLSTVTEMDYEDYESLYKITEQIIKKSIDDFVVSKMYFNEENENFDSYIVENKNTNQKFIIKLSYDIGCAEILNETRILKEEKPLCCNSYVDSGVHRSKGVTFLYLISTKEDAVDFLELGRSAFLEHKDSFIFAILNFKEIKSKKTFLDYFNSILRPSVIYEYEDAINKLEEKSSDFPDILDWTDKEKKTEIRLYFFIIMRTFEKFMLGIYDEEFFNKGETCHGLLSNEKIIFKNGLFKFTDVGFAFSGNSMFDICWVCLEGGFKKSSFDDLIKNYAIATEVEEEQLHKDFYKMMDIVLPLFFARLLYTSFVEEILYQNKRIQEIYRYFFSALNAFKWVDYSIITKKYIKVLTDRLLKPMIDAQVDLDISVADETNTEQSFAPIEVDPVSNVNLKKINKEDSTDLLLSWKTSPEATGYAVYLISPDGSFYKELTYKNSCVWEDVKGIGAYGAGVKCLTNARFKDSEYSRAEVYVDFLDDYFLKIKNRDSYYKG